MAEFTRVASVDEIPPGQAKIVEVNARPIAVFNVQGTFYAITNICPHEGGPLGEGTLKGHIVSCPWHDMSFDIRDGLGTDGGVYCVGSYEIRIEGQDVYVGPRRQVEGFLS